MEASLGQRVVRGPDWEWGDQDGGEGFVGTVAGLEEDVGGVIVQWDMGQRCRYRCGRDNKFDLRVLDCGPSGHSFSKHRCHVCRKKAVCGVVLRCLHCSEYYLCSLCYRANYHCSLHRFTCLLDRDGIQQFRVPARADSRCISFSGLFSGAEVVRGYDWRWRDQDGGEGKTGKVVDVLDWSNEGGSVYERSVVLVTWENGNKKKYRAGHKGKVDVRCVSPGRGGSYYPEHLPVLGRAVKPPSSGEIVTGDRIRCEVDVSQLDNDPESAEKIGLMLDHVGTVNVLLENGELLVRYPGNSLIQVNPAAVTKVDIPLFEPGDVVRMISDIAEVYKLQQGHGEWSDDMALCLDQVGRVMKTPGEDVLVSIAGYRWTLNAHCLRHAPGETLAPESDSAGSFSLLGLLIDSFGPSILVHATSKGDVATVQTFLEKNPHQVNILEQGKTAVHVAVEESRLKVLEVILKFKPDLSQPDADGDAPLHTCAFLNATQAASMLLEAGADTNATNSKRGITPIMIAAAVGHYELLEILATHHSADVNVQDLQGQTALHHVLSSQRTRAIPILLSAGANLTLVNSNLFTPLLEAAAHDSLPGVEDIVRQRPDVIHWQRLADGITPLQLASVRNRVFIVRHFALNGCDLDCRSGQRLRTALHATTIEGHVVVIECLVGFGCDMNVSDNDGNTALHIVFINKSAQPLSDFTPQMNKVNEELSRLHLESVPLYLTLGCFLIQEGADPCVRNDLGQTPAQACPSELRDILLNYINKSNRGAFHGSLRSDRSSTTSKTDNRPSVVNSSPSIYLATSGPHRIMETGGGSLGLAKTGGNRLGGGHGSIMDAHPLGARGGGGRRSQRERDRHRLKDTRRTVTESEEPRVPSAEERETIRKRRQAYFESRATAKKKTTASTAPASVSTAPPSEQTSTSQQASTAPAGVSTAPPTSTSQQASTAPAGVSTAPPNKQTSTSQQASTAPAGVSTAPPNKQTSTSQQASTAPAGVSTAPPNKQTSTSQQASTAPAGVSTTPPSKQTSTGQPAGVSTTPPSKPTSTGQPAGVSTTPPSEPTSTGQPACVSTTPPSEQTSTGQQASAAPAGKQVTEDLGTVKVVKAKKGELAGLESPKEASKTVESKAQPHEARKSMSGNEQKKRVSQQTSPLSPKGTSKTESMPQAKQFTGNELKRSAVPMKQTQRSSVTNSMRDDCGYQQKRRVLNENSEQVQTKTVSTTETAQENRQPQQQGNVGTVTTGEGTSSSPAPKPQVDSTDGASGAVLCFVCERPATAKFAPCGHVVACETCASRARRCPICKVLVKGVS